MINKHLKPFKLCVLQNFPYIEEDFDALTNYQLLCKVVEFLNKTIDAQNEVITEFGQLHNAFIELKNFIDGYLEQALQTDVNAKLDEMAQDGTLENIISQYIDNNIKHIYNSLNLLKIADLQENQKVQTLGYYSLNDGGGATYIIRNTTPSGYYETLDNGKFAELIINDVMSPEQFGAYGNGETDDTLSFTNASIYSKYLRGKGIYKLKNIELNNIKIECDILTNENIGLTFNNNVYFKGTIENGISSTVLANGRCIYIIGKNNIIENSVFKGIYTGCGIVIENSANNNKVINSIFKPSFKIDINVSGNGSIIENCLFEEHTSQTTSTIDDYSNAIKISQYQDLSGTNSNNTIIKNNTMYEHGDNPIDCYTGGTAVIIDGNYIESPNHECIEIKCSNENEKNENFKIVNNTLIGARCIYCGWSSNGTTNNILISGNNLTTTTAAAIILNNVFESIISNNIISGTTTNTYAFNIARPSEQKDLSKLIIDNCLFKDLAAVINLSDDNIVASFNGCHSYNCTRFSRVNSNSTIYINNSIIETKADSFGSISGKLFVTGTYFKNTFSFVINNTSAIVSAVNCKFISSSLVFSRTGGTTPKVAIVCCDYSESTGLSNSGLQPTVDFVTSQ